MGRQVKPTPPSNEYDWLKATATVVVTVLGSFGVYDVRESSRKEEILTQLARQVQTIDVEFTKTREKNMPQLLETTAQTLEILKRIEADLGHKRK